MGYWSPDVTSKVFTNRDLWIEHVSRYNLMMLYSCSHRSLLKMSSVCPLSSSVWLFKFCIRGETSSLLPSLTLALTSLFSLPFSPLPLLFFPFPLSFFCHEILQSHIVCSSPVLEVSMSLKKKWHQAQMVPGVLVLVSIPLRLVFSDFFFFFRTWCALSNNLLSPN